MMNFIVLECNIVGKCKHHPLDGVPFLKKHFLSWMEFTMYKVAYKKTMVYEQVR